MAIDLRQVEPLGSKSVLLEQAMRRHMNGGKRGGLTSDMDMSDMVSPDFAWLNEDKTALKNLVAQMDASIGQVSQQMGSLDERARVSRNQIEKEQQLLFKQIKTLNGLLKKQVEVFTAIESQVAKIEIQQNSLIPQIGIGLVAGLMSAVTILVSAPWMTVLMENIR